MWFKEYRDYKIDDPLVKDKVSPSHGIIGCEMHDLNGWGEEHHIPRKKRKKGLPSILLEFLFGSLTKVW
jgi:hypothetical protein